jgi:hypothetical protein
MYDPACAGKACAGKARNGNTEPVAIWLRTEYNSKANRKNGDPKPRGVFTLNPEYDGKDTYGNPINHKVIPEDQREFHVELTKFSTVGDKAGKCRDRFKRKQNAQPKPPRASKASTPKGKVREV